MHSTKHCPINHSTKIDTTNCDEQIETWKINWATKELTMKFLLIALWRLLWHSSLSFYLDTRRIFTPYSAITKEFMSHGRRLMRKCVGVLLRFVTCGFFALTLTFASSKTNWSNLFSPIAKRQRRKILFLENLKRDAKQNRTKRRRIRNKSLREKKDFCFCCREF